MKRFEFPLERVLAWRRTQAAVEQSKLDQVQAELSNLIAQANQVALQREAASRTIHTSGSATGAELARLDTYRQAAATEIHSLEHRREECRERLDRQAVVIADRRREVKLLERLKERRLATWKAQLSREIEQDAAEAYLSRWNADV